MQPTSKKIKETSRASRSFTASLEKLRSNLGWVIVRVPLDVAKAWGARGRLKVKGDINGFPFRTSLFSTREGTHFVLVNKRMQKGGHAYVGMKAKVRLEPDIDERTVTIPQELQQVFSEARTLQRWFEKLNYSTRKWVTDWITDVKSAEARVRRSEQVAEQLLSAMEAEHELPPMIQLAFARNPWAREGWEQMTPIQRRGQLIAIFYYRTPEGRAKRLAKTIEEAEAVAKKKAGKQKS